jgi:hypothetical protein
MLTIQPTEGLQPVVTGTITWKALNQPTKITESKQPHLCINLTLLPWLHRCMIIVKTLLASVLRKTMQELSQ